MSDEKTSADEAETQTAEDPKAEGKEAGEAQAEQDDDDDGATPEAIARRVAALGEEDAIEKLARDEERKLAERRAGKKKKKGGLEVAASKKLSKIGTRAEPKRNVAVAADADPLIERTAKLSEWAKKNQKTVQTVGALVAAALLGIAGFLYYQNKQETDASVLLSKAVDDERGRVGEPAEKEKDDEPKDTTPTFKTFDDRREAALKKYREVQAQFPKTGAAILARLSEGSLLLDKREADGALAAFNDVKGSALATADQEVRGRAMEGIGFAHELKGSWDEAIKAYKELESSVDVKGFKELAMYHQARVHQNKGENDKAKELLLSLKERLNKPDDNVANLPQGPAFPYLRDVAMDRLREIDPSAAPKTSNVPGGGMQLTPAQIRKMIEDAQKKGADPHGGH
ncbi:MAG: hypothetical protein KF819_34220 [Labilithrix sp.]|nr:hypothetical protein [Labilithrix sp.]